MYRATITSFLSEPDYERFQFESPASFNVINIFEKWLIVEEINDYCADFHPKLRGLSGTETAVDHAAKSFRLYYSKEMFTENASPEEVNLLITKKC